MESFFAPESAAVAVSVVGLEGLCAEKLKRPVPPDEGWNPETDCENKLLVELCDGPLVAGAFSLDSLAVFAPA